MMRLYSEIAYAGTGKMYCTLPNILLEGAELMVHGSRPPGEWASSAGNDPGNFPDFIDHASPFVEKKKSSFLSGRA